MHSGWLTDVLILLPVGGALFIWTFPLNRLWAGSLAFLVSLVEIGFWGAAKTSPCVVLSRPCATSTGAPCVLAWLAFRAPEARQCDRAGHR